MRHQKQRQIVLLEATRLRVRIWATYATNICKSSLNYSLKSLSRLFNRFETNSVDKETIGLNEMRQNESKEHGLVGCLISID